MPEQTDTVKSQEELLDDLGSEVQSLMGNPVSVWAVAATIESLGIREKDVRNEYGYESIFELSEQIYSDLKEEISRAQADEVVPPEEKLRTPGLWEQLKQFIRYYSQGLLFSLPMISQIAALIIFRYSLWAWLEFNEAQATIVAFGTITAFVITGGFVQVIGRSVSSYISSDNYYLAYAASKRIVKSGVWAVIAVALFFYGINLIIPFYPQPMLLLGLVYLIFISLLLLASGVLYALKQRLSILLMIVLGTVIVIFNMDVLHLGIYVSQWIAMALTILMLGGYSVLYFHLKIRNNRQRLARQTLPDSEVRYFINYRYFIYGLCYFLFLFMDRILAWSTGDIPPPYIIWFNTPYELGMDWALITLVLSLAVLEYSVQVFFPGPDADAGAGNVSAALPV